MTYGEKLTEMRGDLRHLVRQLLDADEDQAAAEVMNVVSVINHVRDQLADMGLDDDPWRSQGKSASEGK